MSEIKNGELEQYGAGPFEQQQFGTAGIAWVNRLLLELLLCLSHHLNAAGDVLWSV